MKIRPVGAEIFYAYGRTHRRIDTTKLTVAVRAKKKKEYLLNLLSLENFKRAICSQLRIVITNVKKYYLLYHLH